MKRMIAIMLLLTLTLCGCGGGEAQTPETEATTQATTTATETTQEEQTTEESSEASKDLKALAESCIDKSVEELFALIGEPNSSDYAPSCAGEEGAEDGNLYYDGFIVYTLKQGDSETVVFVE